MQQVAISFIWNAPVGSCIGLVSFSSTATIKSYMLNMAASEREVNLNILMGEIASLQANGGTCIGCGIETGVDVRAVI